MALQLKRRGITRVFPMTGGMEAWMAEGYGVETESFEFLPDIDAEN